MTEQRQQNGKDACQTTRFLPVTTLHAKENRKENRPDYAMRDGHAAHNLAGNTAQERKIDATRELARLKTARRPNAWRYKRAEPSPPPVAVVNDRRRS